MVPSEALVLLSLLCTGSVDLALPLTHTDALTLFARPAVWLKGWQNSDGSECERSVCLSRVGRGITLCAAPVPAKREARQKWRGRIECMWFLNASFVISHTRLLQPLGGPQRCVD
eukprot:5347002-Pleurochrysis_carterae.AAC.1